MKDAKGHGSDSRGAHSAGIEHAMDQRTVLASRAAESTKRYAEAQEKLKAEPNNQWLAANIGSIWKSMMTDELRYAQKYEPARAKEILDMFNKIEGR